MSVTVRHPIPTSVKYYIRNYISTFWTSFLYKSRYAKRIAISSPGDEKNWVMTSDGFHWDGGSSVGCLIPTRKTRVSDPQVVEYIKNRRSELNSLFVKNPSAKSATLQRDPEAFHILVSSFHGKTEKEIRHSILEDTTVSYSPEYPSLLFTGSLLPPRENSLLHEHKVPSYVRAWFGLPFRGDNAFKTTGGIEIHVRGDGRVYDFAYTNFTSQTFQWDYICAPFKTTDRSASLISTLEKLKMDDFWQKEVSSIDFTKDVDVTKVNNRANNWVNNVVNDKEFKPIITNPISVGLDYDIIRIPWTNFYVRADEKMVNHLVPLTEQQSTFFLTMNYAGIGIYSDEMGDFACEILFVGIYDEEKAISLEDPNLTIEELNKKKLREIEMEEAWVEVEENKYIKKLVKREKEEL